MAPAATANGTNGATEAKGTPFLGQQPYGMPNDLVIPKVMELSNTDERLWVSLRPLLRHSGMDSVDMY